LCAASAGCAILGFVSPLPDQPDLFGDAPPPPPRRAQRTPTPDRVGPASAPPEIEALAHTLQQRYEGRLHLGTSSWSFPGWRGLVWDDCAYSDTELSRHGLAAYSRHPLFGTVSLDRAFYRAVDASTYARLARQVPDGFRFVVKAPAEITDATLRMPDSGAPLAPNPHFLDPDRALDLAVRPAVAGLGVKFGVLVFQLPPLAGTWLRDPPALLDKLDTLWRAVVPALPDGTRCALELRDARALTPELLAQLTERGVRYCVGLHDRMPSMVEQLPMLRANWPGDLVCRWNLHQGLRYQQAKTQWEPFDRLQAPDTETREALARAIVGTLAAGYRAFVTINNKAEGSAPLSVVELARAILRLAEAPNDNAP
jgi:uncharacterized protein YecE (DUF72 family)